jgi:hypothetical protein
MRLTLVALAVSMAVCVGGCGGGQSSGPTEEPSAPEPSAAHVAVVRLQETGGFAGAQARRSPPRLVVYADGRAVADGKTTARLTRERVDGLLRDLQRDLAGLPSVVRPDGVAINDASTVGITVRTEQGTQQTVTANGLSAFPQAFPDPLVHAWRELAELTTHVQQTGTPRPATR